jgi:hypothetical protein
MQGPSHSDSEDTTTQLMTLSLILNSMQCSVHIAVYIAKFLSVSFRPKSAPQEWQL